jgi:hypothetical protein
LIRAACEPVPANFVCPSGHARRVKAGLVEMLDGGGDDALEQKPYRAKIGRVTCRTPRAFATGGGGRRCGNVGRVRGPRLRSFVRLWVAGRRNGQAVVALGVGLFPLAAAGQSATVASAMRDKGRRSLRPQ